MINSLLNINNLNEINYNVIDNLTNKKYLITDECFLEKYLNITCNGHKTSLSFKIDHDENKNHLFMLTFTNCENKNDNYILKIIKIIDTGLYILNNNLTNRQKICSVFDSNESFRLVYPGLELNPIEMKQIKNYLLKNMDCLKDKNIEFGYEYLNGNYSKYFCHMILFNSIHPLYKYEYRLSFTTINCSKDETLNYTEQKLIKLQYMKYFLNTIIDPKDITILNDIIKNGCKLTVPRFVKYANTEEEKIISNNFINMLNETRYDNIDKYLIIGNILHNIDFALYDKWVEIGKNIPCLIECGIFTNDISKNIWYVFEDEGYDIPSLFHMALEDNEKECNNYTLVRIENAIQKCIHNATDYALANILYEITKYSYKCASIEKHLIYRFKGHKWHLEESNKSFLRNLIPTSLVREFNKFKIKLLKNLNEDEINTDISDVDIGKRTMNKKYQEDQIKTIAKLKTKMQETATIDKILKEVLHIFNLNNNGFLNKINQKKHLLGCSNGVYDFKILKFRNGYSDDYITFSTNINYIPIKDVNPEYIFQVKKFLKEILPNKEKRDYVLTILATCLTGNHYDDALYIFAGIGSNGKSILVKLLRKVFGNYASSLDVRILTHERQAAGTASPDIADKDGVRMVFMEEPDDKKKWNTGYMKNLTGGDLLEARALFQANKSICPQFKLFLILNKLPDLPGDDFGVWRRIRVIDFCSVFVDNPNPLNDNEYKKDNMLDKKMELWYEAFLSILVDKYREFYMNGFKLHIPSCVKRSTEKFQKMMDLVKEFIVARMIETSVADDTITLSKIYQEFQWWCKPIYGKKGTEYNQHDVRNYLERTYAANFNDDILKGFKIKDIEL